VSPAIAPVSDPAPTSDRQAVWLLAAVVACGAGLRLWGLTRAPPNPFYDAAVRSMGRSWHNFFLGALEPGGSVSIDKPPVDLWVQVASTKLLGFTTFALHLPEAVCGTIAIALLYVAVRSVWGQQAGIFAALALAVLPIAVLTARSDTMDSVLTVLLVAALWASIRALRTGRAGWVLAAAGLVGVAFNVKLAQALVPLPAFAVIWAAAVPRRRSPVLLGAAVTLLTIGMSWIVIASLTPASQRPHPVGSVTGSIYRVVFLFNGVDRVSAKGVPLGPTDPTLPGLLRLVGAPGDYAQLIGIELVAAIALLLALLATVAVTRREPAAPGLRQPASHVAHWTAIALGVWLAVGVGLFSAIRHLQTRYLETASAPLAAVVGVTAAALVTRSAQCRLADDRFADRFPARALAGALLLTGAYAIAVATDATGLAVTAVSLALALVALLARSRGLPGRRPRPPLAAVAAVAALALFALPLRVSASLVDHGVTDAARGNGGAQFSSFLRVRSRHSRYETASDDTLGVVGLISADDRPVLILDDVKGVLVRLLTLERLIRHGAVRYVLLDHPCTTGRGCPATTRWSLRHAVRVRGYLYRYDVSWPTPTGSAATSQMRQRLPRQRRVA
jgi:4-amino-4-deoxy-L-arabinose transferase-like glycosyltransferase